MEGKMEKKQDIREQDGKTYLVIKCSKCGNEMFFKMTDEPRRVYGACANCGKSVDVYVDKK